MNIGTKIKEEEEKIKSYSSSYEKLNIYNNIIQLRGISPDEGIRKPLYSDIKNYLRHSILAIEEPLQGYYEIKQKKIETIISLVSIDEQLSLLNFLVRELKRNGYEEKFDWLSLLIKKRKIKQIWKRPSFRNFFLLLKELSTYNIFSILISILIIFTLYSILLLPAPSENWVCFNSKFNHYSDNKIVNHFINTLTSFCSIDNDFKSNPINIRGVLIEISFKLIVIVLILNYLLEELKSKIKL